MRSQLACVIATVVFIYTSAGQSADMPRTFIQNEDSHPHEVAAGEATRFTLEATAQVARMDVKCSLEGDVGKPLTSVTLRVHGITDVEWPFATRSIRVERRIDFDITALTKPTSSGLAYFEFVNEDPLNRLWHQCYNN